MNFLSLSQKSSSLNHILSLQGSYPKFQVDAPVYARFAMMETRLARSADEVRAAQALRYQVFYQELGAKACAQTKALGYDEDAYDRFCDHLLVIDRSNGHEKIIGTYRLLLPQAARAAQGYYSQNEFDLCNVLNKNPDTQFLELGRSCILPAFRNKRVMDLLWQGTWAYALAHQVDVMFGCASFSGVEPDVHQQAFAWLYKHARLKGKEDCPALNPACGVDMKLYAGCVGDEKRVFVSLPPLLKGYVRVGAKTSSQAVIDYQFGTIDVFVLLKVENIPPRYLAHYGEKPE